MKEITACWHVMAKHNVVLLWPEPLWKEETIILLLKECEETLPCLVGKLFLKYSLNSSTGENRKRRRREQGNVQ